MIAWSWRGRVAYREMLDEQLAIRERVWAGEPGHVILCEHPAVITLGRSANAANILVAPAELEAQGIAVERIERGGDVTYHGPGQLMIYPVVRVKRVVDFLRVVARAIVDTAAELGVDGAEFRCDPAGVWIGDRKVAACGIHVARGVSVHGFALDVATPVAAWRRIRPCGLGVPQTSLATAGGRELEVAVVAAILGPKLALGCATA
ncbi:MAG: lipoyl(octanoyl) transferase LipB [Proteobacteria bacterium]|nr:lipoyl(octanoyl) transferase LipB [Pseudomonadota bacterium]